MAAKTDQTIAEAYAAVKLMNADDYVRRVAFETKMAPLDYDSAIYEATNAGREEGREEGREAGRREMARKALKKSIPLNDIADLTGLSIEEIKLLAD